MDPNNEVPQLRLYVPPLSTDGSEAMGQSNATSFPWTASKRLVDICLALPVVLLVLPPLALLVRVGQWLQSPGPLFFRQERRGQFGVTFTILKFRTMNLPADGVSDICENPVPRIFPIGRFLRNTKLDEIPQFVNVLTGAMSVVGPRPHHLEDCESFEQLVDGYSQRTIVKPGITGLAQYSEYRGDFEWNCVESRVEKDLAYIGGWSLGQDFRLIFATVTVVGLHVFKGATRRLSGGLLFRTPVEKPSVVSMPEQPAPVATSQTVNAPKRRAA